MMQTILVYIIVLACAVYALWKAYGWLRVRRDNRGISDGGSGASCPPGCTGCDGLLTGADIRPGIKDGGRGTGGDSRRPRKSHGRMGKDIDRIGGNNGSDCGAHASNQRNPDTCNVPHHRRNKIPRNPDSGCGCS